MPRSKSIISPTAGRANALKAAASYEVSALELDQLVAELVRGTEDLSSSGGQRPTTFRANKPKFPEQNND